MNHYHQQYLDDISEPEGYEPSQDDITTCVDALLSNKELHFGEFVLEISDVANHLSHDNDFVCDLLYLLVPGNKEDSEKLLQYEMLISATYLVTSTMERKQMMPEIRSIEL